MKHIWLLIILVFSISTAHSQNKFERESRIKRSEVSEKAKIYMESIFPQSRKIKWYLEENLDGIAIEAKVKANKTNYSIKFDTVGNLHDIEFTQRLDELPTSIQQKVQKYFHDNFDRYRIKKIQVQWIGDPDLLRSVLLKKTQSQHYEINYEIVLAGRKDGNLESYEVLFAENGKHIETKKIISRNLNHLVY